MLTTRFNKGFERSLHNALTTDVDPRASGHLAVHEQTFTIQFIEMIPVGPLRYQVRVGNQYARRIGMRFKHAYGVTGLNQQ